MDDRYYWLKLNEHFFDDEKVLYLETLENGEKYILFWQKLLLKCLKNRHDDEKNYGVLRFSEKLPYTPELLSKVTRTEIDTVKVAIDLFSKLGMIEILSDGTIFIEEVNKLIGSESKSAERVRKHRELKLLQCNKSVTFSNNNKRKENKTKENKTKDREKPPYKIFGQLNNVKLTEDSYNKLIKDFDERTILDYIERLSLYIPNSKKPYKDHNAVIRAWIRRDKENESGSVQNVPHSDNENFCKIVL
jgi:predicted phage replisome organizer